jgi:hypothetical protein
LRQDLRLWSELIHWEGYPIDFPKALLQIVRYAHPTEPEAQLLLPDTSQFRDKLATFAEQSAESPVEMMITVLITSVMEVTASNLGLKLRFADPVKTLVTC